MRLAVCRCFLPRPRVLLQDPVDHPAVRVQLRRSRRRLPTVPGRRRVLQHLPHRVPVQPVHTRRLARAHPLHHAGPAHPPVQLHLVHPPYLPASSSEHDGRPRVVHFSSAKPQRYSPPCRYILTPPFTAAGGRGKAGKAVSRRTNPSGRTVCPPAQTRCSRGRRPCSQPRRRDRPPTSSRPPPATATPLAA